MKRHGTLTAACCLVVVWCALPGLTDDGPLSRESAALKWGGVSDVLVTDPMENQARPSMASALNGDLFVAVDNLDDNSIEVFESTDEGKTWSHFYSFTDGSDSRHPSIAFAEGVDDWVFVAYEKVNADDSREVWVMRMHRSVPGFLWNRAKVGGPWSMGSPSEHIEPQITTDKVKWPGSYFVYITYTVQVGSKYPIYFSRSIDRGFTWSTPADVSGGSVATTWLPRPDIAYGEAGLFVVFVKPGFTGSTIANQVWVTRSTTAGLSWESPVQLTSAAENEFHPAVSAAHDRDSVLVIYTKEKEFSVDLDLNCAYSTDGGITWSNHTVNFSLNNEGFADVDASRDADGSGWFHVAYDRTLGASHGIWYTRATTSHPDVWTSGIRVDDYGIVPPLFPQPSIVVDPTKPPSAEACIAWSDDRGTTYDAYFARDWPIFIDGFESGDTTAWSTTVGGP